MSPRVAPTLPDAPRLALGRPVRHSYTRLAVTDGVLLLGVVTAFCGLAGLGDDRADGLILLATGVIAVGVGVAGRRTFARRHRPTPGRILSGLAITWLVLVALGAAVYLATGTIGRVDDALVESAAGFSTTSITTLDPGGLNVAMQLWRASSQWIGGLLGLIVGVVALPLALRSMSVLGRDASERFAPTAVIGRRRIGLIYLLLTLGLGAAYAAVGLGTTDSVVHAMTTISTGGFSSNADSFSSFGTGARVVATVGMVIAGSSIYVVWWLARGRVGSLWRSTELRLYLALLSTGSIVVALEGEGIVDSTFTAASAVTTTGFAVGDWTLLGDGVVAVLLVLIATGSMAASAGGGLRVIRAWTLIGLAVGELRRALDPHAVVVVRLGGAGIDAPSLERVTGYQIAHLGLCGLAAFGLGAAGVDLLGAIYTGVSVVSTHGPGLGTGPFGSLDGFAPVARLLLIPLMLAGRLGVLPLLLALAWLLRVVRTAIRSSNRLVRTARR